MRTHVVATPSVLTPEADSDTAIRIAFRMADPLGLTEVAVEPDPPDNAQLLRLIEAALVRLAAYRRDFIAAASEDVTPPPARTSWHGGDR